MELIYSAFYQAMTKHGSRDTFTALSEQFEARLDPAHLTEQVWWELQIRALSLGRYDELVTLFGEHHPNLDCLPYTVEHINESHTIEMIDWFSLLASSTVEGFSEWAALAESAEQQLFVKPEPPALLDEPVNNQPKEIDTAEEWLDDLFGMLDDDLAITDAPTEDTFEDAVADLARLDGLLSDPLMMDKTIDEDTATDLAQLNDPLLINETTDEDMAADLALFDDLFDDPSLRDNTTDKELMDSVAETAELDESIDDLLDESLLLPSEYTDDEWDTLFEFSLPESPPQEDKPAHVRVLKLPEIPLDQLEETLSWLDDLVNEEAETGEKSLESMDFDEALAWFGDLDDPEHTPATVFDDDFVSAGMAFESKAADKYYEPVDDSLLDDMPPDDPDAALDWLRELLLDMETPSGFDGDLDEVTAWFEENRPG